MKRKMVALMLIAIAVLATGCKKDKAEGVEVKDGTVAVETASPTPIPTPIPVEEEKEPDITEPDFEIPERNLLWTCYDYLIEKDTDILKERWIQIDTAMIAPGFKVSDLIENLSLSDAEYKSNYVEDKLVAAGDTAIISFTRDGFDWFTVYALNCFNETMSLKDLPVTSVTISDAAKPYCYFAAGFSGKDTVGLSYNEVKLMCKDTLKNWTYQEESVKHGDMECLKMTYYSPYDYATLSNAEWTEKTITTGEITCTFYVDAETGKVIDFDSNYGYGEIVWEDVDENEEEPNAETQQDLQTEDDAEESADETNAEADGQEENKEELSASKEKE